MKYLFYIFMLFSVNVYANNVQISPMWNENKTAYFQFLLPSESDLKAAIFKHNQYTYFIFASEKELSIEEKELRKASLVQLPSSDALILRGIFDTDLQTKLQRQKNNLHLEIHSQKTDKKNLLQTKWEKNGLLFELKNIKIIDFEDPNTKEKLIVFSTPFVPLFTSRKYDTPEMTFLPTAQGIAIYPKTKLFNIKQNQDGFMIYPQNPKAFKIKEKNNNLQTDLNDYAKLSNEEFKNQLQQLKQFMPFVSDLGKNRLHLEIAKLNLSQGFAEKSLEALDTLQESSEKNALLFLSYIRQDKPQKALTYWDKIDNPDENLKLWKNTIDDENLYSLEDYQKIILPEKLAFPFWYRLALKALKENNINLLALTINKIEPIDKNTYQNQAYLFLKAQLSMKQENPTVAQEIYHQIAFNPLSAISGEIVFNKIMSDFKANKIDKKQAILELEKIRPLTASTKTEVPVLQNLSRFYYETENPAQALRTDRKLLSITKDIEILKRMKKEFEDFFISHQNPNPFQHIALYREFKELIPGGIKAIQIKQHLLYDLLSLDLLNDAYEVAMKIVISTTGIIHQENALQAYLIAQMLEDSEKIQESRLYLPTDWRQKIRTNNWHPILKKAVETY